MNRAIDIDGRHLVLTNVEKIFWPELRITKNDLLEYYETMAPVLLPHLKERAIVMKRYPNGINGEFFFMKRVPGSRPPWIKTCPIAHGSGIIDFAMAADCASLLWLVNLGSIDLNPWYAPCATPTKPAYLHFDLDPCDADFAMVREAALIVRDALTALGMTPYAKTSGGDGMHLYVAIQAGPEQHDVWAFAKQLSVALAAEHQDVLTSEYRIAKRPRHRILLDYNQNRLGATLASIYSVRPNAYAGVSTPISWTEVERGFEPQQFTLRTVPDRVRDVGDLWAPLLRSRGRFDLSSLIGHNHGV